MALVAAEAVVLGSPVVGTLDRSDRGMEDRWVVELQDQLVVVDVFHRELEDQLDRLGR